MRVLMFNYEYPPLGGGAGNATRYLLRELVTRDDIEIDLITSSVNHGRVDYLSERVRLHFLDIGKDDRLHFQSNRDLLAYSWYARRYVKVLTRKQRYDGCHAFFGIPCGYLAMTTGLPYIVSLRGSDVPFYNPRFAAADRLVFMRLSQRIWRNASAVVANSAGLRMLARESAPQQDIAVIPNGVDTTTFVPTPVPPDPFTMLCVARLIPRKGVEDIVRALALLKDHVVRLVVAGAGPDAPRLKQLAQDLGVADRVMWFGNVPHESLPDIYRGASIFVLPSRNEGMSNTVLEALASGLPVLLTPTGGTGELMEEGVNGFHIRPGHPEDIAGKIRWYIDHPDAHEWHGIESRSRAETMSWRRVAEAYLGLYESMAGGAR